MPIRSVNSSSVAAIALAAASATPALARAQTPLNLTSVTRTLWVIADASPDGNDEQRIDFTDPGQFMDDVSVFAVGDEGANADASAEQETTTTPYSYRGTAIASAGGFGSMDYNSYGYARSEISIDFTTPDETIFYLRYRLDADSANNAGSATARVHFFGAKYGGNFFLEIEQSDDSNMYEPVEGAVFGVLAAGADCDLTVELTTSGAGYNDGAFITSAEFEFEFTILDTDLDSLLDIWEDEDGVDVDGDKTVDLALAGANPQKKDIFVEYDIVDSVSIPDDPGVGGSEPDPIQAVIDAFGLAPAVAVDNPDNSVGINLHVIDGLDSPVGGNWADPWLSFAQAKGQYLGLPQERSIGDSDKRKAVAEARRLTHRYCIFADDSALQTTGLGERPGDDFMVFVGHLNTGYANIDLLVDATAGTFMHELGHNLGLRHGGIDEVWFKPNYMSVMNYSFQIPLSDPARPRVWWLDYSREQFDDLDETNLVEVHGMGASDPVYGSRVTYWNSAQWSIVSPPLPTLAWGTALGPMDWNDSGLAGDIGSTKQDLNHLVASPAPAPELVIFEGSASYNMNPNQDDPLRGFCDWCSLYYRVFGDTNFLKSVSGPIGRPAREAFDEPFEPPLASLDALVFYQRAATCPGDRNADGRVAGEDLAAVLAAWMTDDPNVDFNEDGVVQGEDLAYILAAWGACP